MFALEDPSIHPSILDRYSTWTQVAELTETISPMTSTGRTSEPLAERPQWEVTLSPFAVMNQRLNSDGSFTHVSKSRPLEPKTGRSISTGGNTFNDLEGVSAEIFVCVKLFFSNTEN